MKPALWKYAAANILACLLLVSCAHQPTFNESVAAGYATIKTVAESVASARDAGYINQAKADDYKEKLQFAFNTLNAAERTFNASRDDAYQLLSVALSVTSTITQEMNNESD